MARQTHGKDPASSFAHLIVLGALLSTMLPACGGGGGNGSGANPPNAIPPDATAADAKMKEQMLKVMRVKNRFCRANDTDVLIDPCRE